MNKKTIKEILINRRVDAELKLEGTLLEGDLNKISCGEVDKLSFAIINLLNSADIPVEFTSYADCQDSSKIIVGNKIRFNLNEDIDVEQLIQTFLIRITLKNNETLPLLNTDLIKFNDIIENQASNFLQKNENKQIKQGLEVKAESFHFKLDGKFTRIEQKETAPSPAFSYNCTVIGMFKPSRTAHFKSTTNSTLIAYCEENDFQDLHDIFKLGDIKKFTFQMKCDPMGKKDLELQRIETADLQQDYPLL